MFLIQNEVDITNEPLVMDGARLVKVYNSGSNYANVQIYDNVNDYPLVGYFTLGPQQTEVVEKGPAQGIYADGSNVVATQVTLTNYRLAAGSRFNLGGAPIADPGGGLATLVYGDDGVWRRKYDNKYFGDTPDWFATQTPDSQSSDTTLAISDSDSSYSLSSVEYKGYFKAPTTGTYVFQLTSDDGSWLWIGKNAASHPSITNYNVNDGGAHGADTVTGTPVSLTAGVYYPLLVNYGDTGGGWVLTTRYSINGGDFTNDFSGLLYHDSVTDGFQQTPGFDLSVAPSTGATWTDASGHGFDATITGNFSYVSDNTGGIVLDADRSGYISIPTIIISKTFTMSIVADLNFQNAWATLWGNDSYQSNIGYLAYFNSTTMMNIGSPQSPLQISTPDITTLGRSLYDVVVDDTTTYFYINGALIGSGMFTQPADFASLNTYIGARHQNDGSDQAIDGLPGTFYRIKLVGTALDQTAITAQYNDFKTIYSLP